MPLYWTDSTGDWHATYFEDSTSTPTYTVATTANDWYETVTVATTATTASSLIYPTRWYVKRTHDCWWRAATEWLERQPRRDEWLERSYMQQARADAAALERQRRIIAEHVDTAQSKAMDLLLKHLTPEQRETFRQHKWFIVQGEVTGRRYRIRDKGNVVANIDVLNGEGVEHRLCAHCDPREVPLADNLLAQKLMLEADEEAFLRIANRHAA